MTVANPPYPKVNPAAWSCPSVVIRSIHSPVVNFTHNVANGIPNAQKIASANAIANTPANPFDATWSKAVGSFVISSSCLLACNDDDDDDDDDDGNDDDDGDDDDK